MHGYVLVLTLVNLLLADAIVWFAVGQGVSVRRCVVFSGMCEDVALALWPLRFQC